MSTIPLSVAPISSYGSFYSMLSGDRKLKEKMNRDIEELLLTMAEQRQAPDICIKLRSHEWKAMAAHA